MRVRTSWAVVGVVLAGCGGPRAPTRTPEVGPATPTSAARAADPELAAVVREIDPGPQPPLMDSLPPALRQQLDSALGTTSDREVAVREIREALVAWAKGPPDVDQLVLRLAGLGRGLVLAERAVAAGSDDPELLLALSGVYSLLDSPIFAAEQGVMQQVMQMAAQMARAGGSGDPEQVASLMAGLRDMFKRADALHRRTAAILLLRHGEHPEVARVLGRLAEGQIRREQFARAVELRQMALRRLGARAMPGDHIDLARTCYRALELACGDAARERARSFTGDAKATAEHTRRMTELGKMSEQARRVTALAADPGAAPANDPTPALERGHLLLLLDRFADARALYEALRAAHPDDARPLAGLAKLAVQQDGDYSTAYRHVALARPLAHEDGDFYEVALGTIGVNFLYAALPRLMQGQEKFEAVVEPMLTDMHAFAVGLRPHQPARAAAVELLVGAVQVALPAFQRGDTGEGLKTARGLSARVEPLVAKFPDSPDVRRLQLLAANFAGAAKTSLAAVRAPLPAALAGDVALQRARVKSWLDLALAWEEAGDLAGIEAAATALPTDDGDGTRDTVLAAVLAARFMRDRDRGAGERAAEIYEAQARAGSDAARAVALNNLGLLRVGLGDPTSGLEHFMTALELDPTARPALLNLAATVLTLEGGQRPQLVDAFATVASEAGTAALRVQAEAWRHAQAERGIGDVEQTRAAFWSALDRDRKAEVRGNLPLGRWGLITTGSVQISFQYSVPQGFELRHEVSSTAWLISPAPGLEALLAAPRKPGKKRK